MKPQIQKLLDSLKKKVDTAKASFSPDNPGLADGSSQDYYLDDGTVINVSPSLKVGAIALNKDGIALTGVYQLEENKS